MGKIAVLIVDDHAVVRQGLRSLLELQEEIQVVGEAANGAEAVELTRLYRPDVVLMDLIMPEMDGAEATRMIRDASPATRVIVLTSFSEDEQVFSAIRAGALSYLLKNVSPPDLVKAILAASRNEAQLHPEIARKLMREVSDGGKRSAPDDLTERELTVLQLLARGHTNREIAGELVISEKTVKTHVSNILGKLQLSDRTQAAIYALREGLATSR